MDNHNLDPKLKKMLNSLQEIPERDLQNRHAGRENYIAQIKSLKPRQTAIQKPAQQRKSLGRQAWITRFAAVTAVILVALTSLGGTVIAAQAAQPDDLLYPVKTFTEEIQLRLEGDPEEKMELYLFFANRRMQEIHNQLAAGEQVSEKALELLEMHTRNMLQQAANLNQGAMEKALVQIENNLQQQGQMMTALENEGSHGIKQDLEQSQEKIRERLELVREGIKEPKGFKDRMRHEKSGEDKPDANMGDPVGPGTGPDGSGTPSGNGTGGK